MGIDTYSTTAASNTALFPENMNPSAVNDGMRQVQADIRADFQDAEWKNWGYTHVYVGATQFKIAGTDVTSTYTVGRRVKLVAATPGTIYGKITVSSFSTDTTITIAWDSGSLSNEAITSVSLATVKGASTGRSVDLDAVTFYGTAVASATTINLDSATGDYVHVTGTTTIEAVTLASGRERKVVFDDALTLTHNATSLILPSGTNITTAAGDVAVFRGEGSGNTRCISYTKASGLPVITTTIPFTAASASGAASLEFAEDTDNGSNKITLKAPAAVTSDVDVTFPDKTGTIAMTSDLLTLGTAQATTSGSAINFTGIPAGVKEIKVVLNGVSRSGASPLLVQIGDSGGIENTGYESSAARASASETPVTSTAGYVLDSGTGVDGVTFNGIVTLVNVSGNIWVASGSIGEYSSGYAYASGGTKTLSATLDRVTLTMASGSFDAGSMNITYQ
jgi:hypothetical protein